ncbi:MAG: HAMP domain-containing protein [Treponema sp.]|nr:HAMP domain-containing protein [Treponema sp.]
MNIRMKMLLVVLPLVVVILALAQAASYFNAVNGVTRLARELLGFKLREMNKFADGQWSLLIENGFAARPDMIEAAQTAVRGYAEGIVLSGTERIFAMDSDGRLVMTSGPLEFLDGESDLLMGMLRSEPQGLLTASVGGENRVFQVFYFLPFDWYILISETHAAFYRDSDNIASQSLITLLAAVLLISLFLAIMTGKLTGPLRRIVAAMDGIIGSADLSARVKVEYRDETGRLAWTFNRMLGELESAYSQIKRYAFEAVLAKKKEQRIRQIFQKYVPATVIERFFASPEKMLVGDNRNLSILFSDIRSFTTISEGMAPDDLVNSLNRYFSGQVDIIYGRGGVVDKYIGDAIMAFWGAPNLGGDDALQSVLAGLDMIDQVGLFNENQRSLGKPEFRIGIGLNYGEVTVGNIGSERKMDYTVIGDSVNLASRMEGLTKNYGFGILLSESVHAQILRTGIPEGENLDFRLIDTVAVKGKARGVKIYTVGRRIGEAERAGWQLHDLAMDLYYRRSFKEAAEKFREVYRLLSNGNVKDSVSEQMYRRCAQHAANPPPADWDGVEVMESK